MLSKAIKADSVNIWLLKLLEIDARDPLLLLLLICSSNLSLLLILMKEFLLDV